MKAIMITYDTLCRHMLSPYGNRWVRTPNFERLARRAVTFDGSYIGSFPTMPCRRELHTGRVNFLHREWGPLEPFDDSAVELIGAAGVRTHLATDNKHYFEDGAGNYHARYGSWEHFRGQEADRWKGEALEPDDPALKELEELYEEDFARPIGPTLRGNYAREAASLRWLREEADFPQTKTFDAGLAFIERNARRDDWFLHIETFDPHQPFVAPPKYRDLYPTDYTGPDIVWPPRETTRRPPEAQEHIRALYAALVSMCDANLGRVIDAMDAADIWKDTLLIVNTDHGFLLGEHGRWNKMWPWLYEEIARTPLFVWDPDAAVADERRDALVQAIDWAPTLLDFFGLDTPPDMQGRSLRPTLRDGSPVHDAVLFGMFREHVHCADGRYVYVRGVATPDNSPLFNYTLMPAHMTTRFGVDETRAMETSPPFSFTKGCPVARFPARRKPEVDRSRSLLFDLEADPGQNAPIEDEAVESRMIDHLVRLMKHNDAPRDQYERLGLDPS